jgi:L-2,4-diaminobutyrate decarboxylase
MTVHAEAADLEQVRTLFSADRFRSLGHAMVDLLASHLESEFSRTHMPVMSPGTPHEVVTRFPATFPERGDGDVLSIVKRALADSTAVHDPRFIGHQVAPPLPDAALLDLVAALSANGMAVFEMGKAGVAMERAVLLWMARALGYDDQAGGVLTHGGSLGNLTALLAARQACTGLDVWRQGQKVKTPLAIAVAESAHYSVARAARMLGLGNTGVLTIPCDDESRMRVDALDDTIAEATRRGIRVFAVVAQAGATITGAFDPFDAIADVCAARDVWMHVDGAHGASLVLSRRRRALTEGIGRADSVVWDAHKMMMMPALVTAVLFKDSAAGAHAFAQEASYLFHDETDDDEWADVGKRTIECTKRMMSLKLYATLMAHGTSLFATHVDAVIDMAEHLAERLRARPVFELLCAPMCNIVCFRVRDLTSGQQAAVRRRLVDDGRFYIVKMRVHGTLWLRAVVLNPHTRESDLDALLDEIEAVAREIRGS